MARWEKIVSYGAIGVAALFALSCGASGHAEDRTSVLVKILTKDKQVCVGQLTEETDARIELIDLTTNETKAISTDQIQQVRKGITENDAAQSIGLEHVLAWKTLNTIPKETPSGRIVKIDQATVYVSLGAKTGVKEGQELRAYRGKTELKDPVTGEVLGVERKRVARLIVTEVNKGYSKARTQGDLEVTLEVGDAVEPTGANNRIVILPFVGVNGEPMTAGNELAEQLTSALVQRNIRVVERSRLSAVLAELLMQNSAGYDAEKAQKVGKQLGAHAALLGTLSSSKAMSEANIRLVEIETGKILFAGKYRIAPRGSGAPSVAAASPPGDNAERSGEDRRFRWFNESYDQTLVHVRGKLWTQVDNKTHKADGRLIEIRRTADYVELSGFNFGVGRLSGKLLEMKKGDKWEWVANGHWETNQSPKWHCSIPA